MDKFDLPSSVIICSALGDYTSGGHTAKKIRDGNFTLSKKDYERAKFELYYAAEFKQVSKSIGGTKFPFFMAVIYAYKSLDTESRNRLMEVVRKRAMEIPSMTKPVGYLKYLDGFYNQGLRKEKRIHLELQWNTDNI